MDRQSQFSPLSAPLRGQAPSSGADATRASLALTESVLWAGLIFLFCIIDAVCTVIHTGGGATEMNPIMDCFLAMGPHFFVAMKVLISGVTLGVLCTLLPRIRNGRLCFFMITVPYFAVCCYHATGFVR